MLAQNHELFKQSALQQISKIIADKFTGSQIVDFFKRIGINNIATTESTKWKFVCATLEQLQNTKGRHEIVRIIEQFCDGQEFFGENTRRFDIIQKINEVLSFYKMEYDLKLSHVIIDLSIKPKGPSIKHTKLNLRIQ